MRTGAVCQFGLTVAAVLAVAAYDPAVVVAATLERSSAGQDR
jgi:hypothetical protein